MKLRVAKKVLAADRYLFGSKYRYRKGTRSKAGGRVAKWNITFIKSLARRYNYDLYFQTNRTNKGWIIIDSMSISNTVVAK